MKMKTRRLMGLLAATMACGLTQISCSNGDTPVGTPVDMKQALTPETRQQCEALGEAMAQGLRS